MLVSLLYIQVTAPKLIRHVQICYSNYNIQVVLNSRVYDCDIDLSISY